MFTEVKAEDSNQYLNRANNYYIYLFFLTLLAVYWLYAADIFEPIVKLWSYSGSYNYCYIVFILSTLWVFFNLYINHTSNTVVINPSVGSLLGITLCVFLALLAFVAQLMFVIQILMLLLLWFLIRVFFGKDVAISIINPFVLILFSLPIFKLVSSSEQIWIKFFLIFNLDTLGILTGTMANKLETSNLTILINKTYTGLRYLNVIFVISFVTSHYLFNKLTLKILYIITSLLLTFLLNLIRVLCLILYAHYNGVESFKSILVPGSWLCFLIMLCTIFFVGILFKEFDQKKKSFNLAHKKNHFDQVNFNLRLYFNFIIIFVLLVGFGSGKEIYRQVIHSMPETNFLSSPVMLSMWQSHAHCQHNNWYPKVGRPDAKLLKSYKKDKIKRHVDLYIGYYEHQYLGNSLTNINAKFNYDQVLQQENSSKIMVKVNIPEEENGTARIIVKDMSINRDLIKADHAKRVIWYWYWINGQTTNNKLYAKWLELFDIIKSLKTHSALIAISAEFNSDEELIEAEAALYDFMNDNYNSIYPKAKRIAVVV